MRSPLRKAHGLLGQVRQPQSTEHGLPPWHQIFRAGTGNPSHKEGQLSSRHSVAFGWEKPAAGASTFLARLRACKGQPSSPEWHRPISTCCSSHQGTHLEKKSLRPTRTSSQLLGGHVLGLAGLQEFLSLCTRSLSVQTSSCTPNAGVRPTWLQSSTSSYRLLKQMHHYQIICL